MTTKDRLFFVYMWFLRECPAPPDSGEVVDAGARKAFGHLCHAMADTNCLVLEEQNHAATKDENQSLRALLRAAREYVNYAAAAAIALGSRNAAAESLLAKIDALGPAPLIWVCRDIPGEHVGGPECFCCPTRLETDAGETTEQLAARVAKDQRPQ